MHQNHQSRQSKQTQQTPQQHVQGVNSNSSSSQSVGTAHGRSVPTLSDNSSIRSSVANGAPIPAARNSMVSSATDASEQTPVIPLIGMVQDVVCAMILNVPALRTKLQAILENPSLIGTEINNVYDELKTKLTAQELEQLNSYACQDNSRRTIGSVMQSAFSNIMADGRIDMSDAPHFLKLVHDCITMFSAESVNGAVDLNSETVITFIHFVLKCILILTLDGPEEDSAIVMLDGSFKLVKLTVLPLVASKTWCVCGS